MDAPSDAAWLRVNLGAFSTLASYADLKDFNITVVRDAPLFDVAVVTWL